MNKPISRVLDPLRSFEKGKRYALIRKRRYAYVDGNRVVWPIVFKEFKEHRAGEYFVCSTNGDEYGLLQSIYYWYKVPEDFPYKGGDELKNLNIGG